MADGSCLVLTNIDRVVVLDGIVNGATRELTRYVDTSPASVFVAQRGVTNMHMASSSVPLAEVGRIRALPGVTRADPILYAPDALSTADTEQLTYVIGYVPGGRGGAVSLAAGRDPKPGEIVIDERAARNLGLSVGGPVRILGRTWRLSGFTSGLTNLANTVAFVRFDDFADARSLRDTASYILVGTAASPDAVAGRIEATTGLTALVRSRFSAQEPGPGQGHERPAPADHDPGAVPDWDGRDRPDALHRDPVSPEGGRRDEGPRGEATPPGRRRARPSGVDYRHGYGAGPCSRRRPRLGLGPVRGQHLHRVRRSAVVRVAIEGAVLGALGAVAPLIKVWRVDPVTVFRG